MDNFKAVYKILSTLEKAMDLPEFDISVIDYKAIGVSKERWSRYIEMMADVGYIKGVRVGIRYLRNCHSDSLGQGGRSVKAGGSIAGD